MIMLDKGNNKFRPIQISNAPRKQTEKSILCLLNCIDAHFPQGEQYGGKAAQETSLAIKLIHEEFKRGSTVIFLDIKGAYDNIDRLATYAIMNKIA